MRLPLLGSFPDRRFAAVYFRRALWIWGGIRFALGFSTLFLDLQPFGPASSLFVAVGVAGGVALDARVRREDLLLGNLGVPLRTVVVLAFVSALLFELTVVFVRSAAG